ncbi:MAG: hypothetical protein K2Z80_30380 [Xanthobacteraceae bacterium]|nr:hypothetical protein [Xanthobacteraceae bacterium]
MIQIVVRVIPGGDHKRAFEQAVAEVVAMEESSDRMHYAISVGESQNPCVPAPDWSVRGHIMSHNRRQSVWRLVERVAKFAGDEAEKAAGQRDT